MLGRNGRCSEDFAARVSRKFSVMCLNHQLPRKTRWVPSSDLELLTSGAQESLLTLSLFFLLFSFKCSWDPAVKESGAIIKTMIKTLPLLDVWSGVGGGCKSVLGIGEEQRDHGKGELNHKQQCSVCWSSSGSRAEPSGVIHWLLINSTWKNRGEEGELSLEMELFFCLLSSVPPSVLQ